MSLYRKYRPQHFAELHGQEHVADVLLNALKKDRVAHAYLFTGPRGTGKTSSARILARALNCQNPTESGPCNTCEFCVAALEERLTDIIEIDAASHGLVDDARALVEQAKFMPSQAKKKVYIIDEVHMLSKSAFNALLKIIEEPPAHVHFILATTEAHKVLATIVSRCQRFDFHLADTEQLLVHLKEVIQKESLKFEEPALMLIAQHARGSYRDALSLLEQMIDFEEITVQSVQDTLGLSEDQEVKDFLRCLQNNDAKAALELVHQVYQQGHDLYQFCQSIVSLLRTELLNGSTPQQSLRFLEVFLLALEQSRNPVVPELPLEIAVMKCVNLQPDAERESPESLSTPKIVEPAKPRALKKTQKDSTPTTSTVEKETPQQQDTKSSTPPSTTANFDKQAFLNAVQQVSLRTLLKFSQLSFDSGELCIVARSTFEKDKLKEQGNLQYMTQVIRDLMRAPVTIQVVLDGKAAAEPQPEKTSSLSSSDLESVF